MAVGPWPKRTYVAISAVLIAAYPMLPGFWRNVDFLLISFGTVPAVAAGLRRTPRGDKHPWWLLLSSLISLNLGNVAWFWYAEVEHRPNTHGTIADLFGSIGPLLMLSAAMAIIRLRGRNDVGGIIDTTIASMAAGGLLWNFVLLPHFEATGQSLVAQAPSLIGVLVLTGGAGALGRLQRRAGRFIPALWIFVGAMLLSLFGNIAVELLADPVTGTRPVWTYMMFMVAYTGVGAIGLESSSAELTRLGAAPVDNLTPGRLALLGAAVAVVPVVGGGRELLGYQVDGLLMALGGIALTPLVMIRIGRLSAERARAERALIHQATHDALTGLPNRRDFADRLTAELARPQPDRVGPVVLFCDLDGFKPVNDRLGHAAGDELLVQVGRRLRDCVRERDVVSRFGGDEFLIMCRDTADSAELIERIGAALAVPIDLGVDRVVVGASIGAVTADPRMDAAGLISQADAAMYDAKRRRPASRESRSTPQAACVGA